MIVNDKRRIHSIEGQKPTFFLFGFDRIGFRDERKFFETEDGDFIFVEFGSSTRLDASDGVVLPQSIFEEIEVEKSILGEVSGTHSVFRTQLLAREREINNLLSTGNWVCVLLGGRPLIDSYPDQYGLSTGIVDTDLAKRLLNSSMITKGYRRNLLHKPISDLNSRFEEFRGFIEEFGVAQMEFSTGHNPAITNLVAKKTLSMDLKLNEKYSFFRL